LGEFRSCHFCVASSEISDFTPYAHAQSNILHVECDDETDY